MNPQKLAKFSSERRVGVTLEDVSANGVQISEEFTRVHGQGGDGGLWRGRPKITVYDVAAEPDVERYYGLD